MTDVATTSVAHLPMRAHLRTFLVILATVALLALFLRQANLAEVWHEIRQANPVDLGLSLATVLIVYVMRAVRWQAMLVPLGHAHFKNAFRATVIGFAANALLPARAGEVLRPFLLARREGFSATSTFATILLERLFDLVTVLMLFGLFVLLADPSTTRADPALYRTVQFGGLLAGAASVTALVFVFVAAGHPERLGRMTRRAERFLPARIAHALAHMVERFAGGFAVVRRPGEMGRVLLLSFPVWLAIAAGIWFVARAFHITMSFLGTFLVVALLTVGVAVPTPGAVGGFHYAFRVGATTFFGVAPERAVGAAIVLHAISFLPVTLLGLAFMVQDGLNLSNLKRMAAGAEAENKGEEPKAAGEGTAKPGAADERADA